MAVEARFQDPAAAVVASALGSERSFSERLGQAVRRRRLQRLQHGLVTACWVGGSGILLALATAGVLGLH